MLYSYCIPVDNGAAPNPFWSYCTLAICKPAIRRVAEVGDWIIGTGSRRSPLGDIGGYLVYAMEVTGRLPMEEYDSWVKRYCPRKIPKWKARDHRHRLGDAIYDFRCNPPSLRESVHDDRSRRRLRRLAPQMQGHRSRSNATLLKPFLILLRSLRIKPNRLYGKPQVSLCPSSLLTLPTSEPGAGR